MPQALPDRLDGWKAIAAYLGKDERTVRRWEKDFGLPVHRVGSRGASVYAFRGALDAWIFASPEHTRGAGSADIVEDGGLPGSQQSREIQQQGFTKGRHIDLAIGAPSAHVLTFRTAIVAAAVLAAVLAILGTRRVFTEAANPALFTLEGKLLTILDHRNQKVWSYVLPESQLLGDQRSRPRGLFVDLDSDGKNEFLFVFHQPSGSRGDILYCFESDGGLRWLRAPGRPIVTPLGRPFTGGFWVWVLGALKQPRSDGGRIVVGSSHQYSWPYQVVLLDSAGRAVAEYWHPGWLWRLAIADLDEDGAEEILLGGVNDSYGDVKDEGKPYRATLVVLDSRRMGGHGPVTGKDDRVVTGIPPADEAAVLVLRALTITGDENAFYRVTDIFLNAGGLTVTVGTEIKQHPHAFFQFDRRLRLSAITPELNFQTSIYAGLPPDATAEEKFRRVRERLGKVKILKNRWASSLSASLNPRIVVSGCSNARTDCNLQEDAKQADPTCAVVALKTPVDHLKDD